MSALQYDITRSEEQVIVTVGLPAEAPFDQIDVALVGETQLEVVVPGCDSLHVKLPCVVDTAEAAYKVRLSRKKAQLTVTLTEVAKGDPAEPAVPSQPEPAPVIESRDDQNNEPAQPSSSVGRQIDPTVTYKVSIRH